VFLKCVCSVFVFFVCFFQPQQGIGRPSVYHAVVVIFLEFFAWGLLTTPMLTVSTTGGRKDLQKAFFLIPKVDFIHINTFSFYVNIGFTRDVPPAHVPDERTHSGCEGKSFNSSMTQD